jgi:hypothetical protein
MQLLPVPWLACHRALIEFVPGAGCNMGGFPHFGDNDIRITVIWDYCLSYRSVHSGQLVLRHRRLPHGCSEIAKQTSVTEAALETMSC